MAPYLDSKLQRYCIVLYLAGFDGRWLMVDDGKGNGNNALSDR
jgi:hypothetical protein